MDYTIARKNMVDGQLRPNRINQPALLARMGVLPRESFAPGAGALVYADEPIELSQNHSLFSPLVQAHLVQNLQLGGEESVLVVHGGSGYGAAVVAGIAQHVTYAESDAATFTQAEKQFKALNINNISCVKAGLEGPDSHKTFDAVLVDAPVAAIPAGLVRQVKEGGRVAYVLQAENGVAQAVVGVRHGNVLFNQNLFETKWLAVSSAGQEAARFSF